MTISPSGKRQINKGHCIFIVSLFSNLVSLDPLSFIAILKRPLSDHTYIDVNVIF